MAEFVEEELHRPLGLEELARQLSLSPFHFARVFRATTGSSPHGYVNGRRVERAKVLLLTTDWSVERITRAVGFTTSGDSSRPTSARDPGTFGGRDSNRGTGRTRRFPARHPATRAASRP